MSARRGGIALAVALTAALACAPADESPAGAPRPLDPGRGADTLIVLVVDGLRPDHLAAYGSTLDPTPELDALAKGALVFEDCVAACTGLNGGLASLLTGQYAQEHGVGSLRHRGQEALAEERTTLPEHLAALGWRTLALFASPQLDPSLSGLAQGCAEVRAPRLGEGGARTVEQVWLDGRPELVRALESDAPVFALLELADLSLADLPPRPASARFLRARLGPFAARDPLLEGALVRFDEDPAQGVAELGALLRRGRGSPAYEAFGAAAYDARLALVDEALGDLWRRVEASGRAERTVLAVTGTRGQVRGTPAAGAPGFGPELVRLPLLLRLPGAGGARVALPVSTVDLAPTLLDAVGAPPLAGATGVSALDPDAAAALAARARFCEAAALDRRAAFGPRYHVEENRIAGDVAYTRAGLRVARESALAEAERAEIEHLRAALSEFRRPATVVVASGGGRRWDVRWRFAEGWAGPAWVESAGRERRAATSSGQGGSARLEAGDVACTIEGSRRSLPCRLELEALAGEDGPVREIDEGAILLGGLALDASLAPRLPGGKAGEWPRAPDGALAPAAVALDQQSGSWWWLRVGAEEGAGLEPGLAVEVLAVLFPPGEPDEELAWSAGPEVRGETLSGHADAVLFRGVTPLELQLERTPARDLALAVRVAGRTLPAASVRVRERRFSDPALVTLYLPDWLAGTPDPLAGADEPGPVLEAGALAIRRVEPSLPYARRIGLEPDDLRLLRRLEGGE